MSDFLRQAEALIDAAVLGAQVDEFWRSDVGKYLNRQIEEDVKAGLNELKQVTATDARLVMEAQNKVLRAEQVRGYIESAIKQGLVATNVLEQREEEDNE